MAWLVWWLLTLASYALISIGGAVGASFGGIICGLMFLYLWFLDEIRGTYYDPRTPEWMRWLAGKPKESWQLSWYSRLIFSRVTSATLAATMFVGFMVGWGLRGSHEFLAVWISLAAIWIAGVALLRHR